MKNSGLNSFNFCKKINSVELHLYYFCNNNVNLFVYKYG